MTGTKMKIEWHDAGHEPTCDPDPRFPDGIDVDVSRGSEVFCRTALPYPAKRCGAFIVECPKCGARAYITTAGRPDDPRSLKMACRYEGL